ncbi:DUF7313 family protein [Halapricum desulfuricans]|uniref:Putative membrane protein n=1 Tax=Halapricum desulfuricans TaxID=2841257 RepID=A0A897N7G3_9EURY|nr:hypothetical protein [Halapricum desulfuricans]QSG07123.1 putative membrane protein [Halapricum desulfuricans]
MSAPAYQLPGPLGAVDSVLGGAGTVEYLLLGLLLVNVLTRLLAHRSHVSEAGDDAERLSRHPLHVASNVAMVLTAFYYTTLDQHAGIVASTLILGLFVTDFFEFEARNAELRRGVDLDAPKGAIGASVLALLYVGYLSLFQFVAPFWSAIV